MFQTVKKSETAEITEKKSKFISNIFYVESCEEAEKRIDEIRKKYHDAKHNCFAYRIVEEERVIERASDDGEPSGTAGAPMLQFLAKNELVNTLVIVTRYFGGILLGTGGLVRAYTQATSDVVEKADITNLEKGELIKLPITYQNLAYIQHYCKKNNISILKTNFENEPYAILEVTLQEKEEMLYVIREKQFDIKNIEIVEKRYIQKDKQ